MTKGNLFQHMNKTIRRRYYGRQTAGVTPIRNQLYLRFCKRARVITGHGNNSTRQLHHNASELRETWARDNSRRRGASATPWTGLVTVRTTGPAPAAHTTRRVAGAMVHRFLARVALIRGVQDLLTCDEAEEARRRQVNLALWGLPRLLRIATEDAPQTRRRGQVSDVHHPIRGPVVNHPLIAHTPSKASERDTQGT